MARYLARTRRILAQKVLHTDDTPHAIALGAAMATFVAFLPLVGLQTLISVSLAALLRANKAVCIPIVWITNPVTLGPIYGACFGLGRIVLATSPAVDEGAVLNELQQHQQTGLFELAFWQGLLDRLGTLALELWVGCAIVGLVTGVGMYFFARWGVVSYRERRRQRILMRTMLRSKPRHRKVARRSEPA